MLACSQMAVPYRAQRASHVSPGRQYEAVLAWETGGQLCRSGCPSTFESVPSFWVFPRRLPGTPFRWRRAWGRWSCFVHSFEEVLRLTGLLTAAAWPVEKLREFMQYLAP